MHVLYRGALGFSLIFFAAVFVYAAWRALACRPVSRTELVWVAVPPLMVLCLYRLF